MKNMLFMLFAIVLIIVASPIALLKIVWFLSDEMAYDWAKSTSDVLGQYKAEIENENKLKKEK